MSTIIKKDNIANINNQSHIIPIFIGNAIKAKQASDRLIKEFGIYLQPINFPTVERGQEILRISPTPNHTDEMINYII